MGILKDAWDWLQGKTPPPPPSDAQKEAAKYLARNRLPVAVGDPVQDPKPDPTKYVAPLLGAVAIAALIFFAGPAVLAAAAAAAEGIGTSQAAGALAVGVMAIGPTFAQAAPAPAPIVETQTTIVDEPPAPAPPEPATIYVSPNCPSKPLVAPGSLLDSILQPQPMNDPSMPGNPPPDNQPSDNGPTNNC